MHIPTLFTFGLRFGYLKIIRILIHCFPGVEYLAARSTFEFWLFSFTVAIACGSFSLTLCF